MTSLTPFDEMERVFEQMRRSLLEAGPRYGGGFAPAATNLRMEPTDDGYVVHVDLPGFETDEIDLWFEDDTLSIEARHETADDSHEAFRSRRVSERVRVPGEVVVDDIDASYRNGVLEVRLPTEATPEDRGHRIDLE